MSTRQTRQSRFRTALYRLPSILLLGYFAYHALHGDHGLFAKHRLNYAVQELQTEHDALVEERMALERRVALLRDQTLDPDMLDERMRAALNMAHPDEILLLVENN
jgi:cell division protein FtsB